MFEIANLWILLIIPLPLLIWYLIPQARIRLAGALKVPFYDAMQRINHDQQRAVVFPASLIIPAIIWLLLVTALSGPRWVGEPLPVKREGYNIMMVLDLSGSMEMTDMVLHNRLISRLMVVKQAAKHFVEERKGDRIGLILFGTQAYLQTPLTYDRHSVLLRLEDATVGLAGKTTSIGDAVGLAVKRLEDVPEQGRVIILLTDGVNNSGVVTPLKAAELAQNDRIKIYTIGLGSESDPRAMIADNFFNLNASADLDEDTLKKMAKMTGGHYFRATDPDSLHAIYQTINQLERIKQDSATIRPQKEYFPWLIGLALILTFFFIVGRTKLLSNLKDLRAQQEAVNYDD